MNENTLQQVQVSSCPVIIYMPSDFMINSLYKRKNQCFSHGFDRSYSIEYTIQSSSQLAVQNAMKYTGEIIFIDKVEFINLNVTQAVSLPFFILCTIVQTTVNAF